MQLSVLLLTACAACLCLCLADRQDYELLPGFGRYRYGQTKMSWEEARSECESDGAILAVIDAAPEARALKNFYNRKRGGGDGITTYIGFNDKDTEGVYMTVKGKTLDRTGYNVWKYPPTGNAENRARDCGGMIVCGRLTDLPCSTPNTFICELDEEDVEAE